MDKNKFDNTLRQQCMSIPELCSVQIAGIQKGMKDSIPLEVLEKCRRITVTGCGDSYVAAKAAIPAFKKYVKRTGYEFIHERAIHVARYMKFDRQVSDTTLVIVVSCSGAPTRIQEVLQRANYYGCHTLAVTNNPEGRAAQEAEYSLIVNTPVFPNATPGLRNYYASLVGLYMLAAYFGKATGNGTECFVEEMEEAIRQYTSAYTDLLDEYDNQMFELANKWKNFKSFDLIGDDVQYCTAFFIAAKFAEVAGGIANVDDSEDWCHVPFFQKNPGKIGTIIVADRLANDRSRIRETVKQAVGIGRPVLLLANGTKEDFGITADIEVCTLPDTPKGYEFISVLMNYLPGSILAGYIATLLNEPFFRGKVGVWKDPGAPIFYSNIEVI